MYTVGLSIILALLQSVNGLQNPSKSLTSCVRACRMKVSCKAYKSESLVGEALEPSRSVAVIVKFALATLTFCAMTTTAIRADTDLGASDTSNTKIQKGGASTLQAGIAKTITRGVNLDKSNFSGQNLKGVAFQQSIVRDTSFKDCNLYSASFFDATLDGSDFTNADMTLANIELAQFSRAIMRNTIAKEMYVVGTTQFEGIADIENSDWTNTDLSKYQRKLLCSLDSAKGTNEKTGVDTRESLLCPD